MKKPTKKKPSKKPQAKKDFAQSALSAVEKAIGGKLSDGMIGTTKNVK